MWIEVRPGGTLAVRTDQDTYELGHAPGVLLGGELDTPGPATYQGTLRSVSDGIMTLSLTADDGYRIPVPDGLLVVDVRSGSGVPLSDLVDEDLSVFVDADGVAATVQHLPRGPG